ncbi:MAG: alpha/beta fold hydrolase [Bryobacterales bacterium]
MRNHALAFYSDGLRLDASLYCPEEAEACPETALLVICSGFMGLKNIHPERFARQFAKLGYPCFGFDYRGFGRSEGARGQVCIDEQVRDIANGVAYVRSLPAVKNRRLVLMGWGMGGGMILEAARLVSGVVGLVAVNGFYDAERIQLQVRGAQSFTEFRDWLQRETTNASRTGVVTALDPFQIYPLDAVTRQYVDGVLRRNADFGGAVTLTTAWSLMQFAPERRLAHLRDVPIFVVHGERNALHAPSEAQSLYENYPGPKQIHWIPSAGHTEWMLDHDPVFQAVVGHIDCWVRDSAAVRV